MTSIRKAWLGAGLVRLVTGPLEKGALKLTHVQVLVGKWSVQETSCTCTVPLVVTYKHREVAGMYRLSACILHVQYMYMYMYMCIACTILHMCNIIFVVTYCVISGKVSDLEQEQLCIQYSVFLHFALVDKNSVSL